MVPFGGREGADSAVAWGDRRNEAVAGVGIAVCFHRERLPEDFVAEHVAHEHDLFVEGRRRKPERSLS